MGGSASKQEEEKSDTNTNEVVVAPGAFTSIDVHGNSVLTSVAVILVLFALASLAYVYLRRLKCCKSSGNHPAGTEGHRRETSWYGDVWPQNRGLFSMGSFGTPGIDVGSWPIDGTGSFRTPRVESTRFSTNPNPAIPLNYHPDSPTSTALPPIVIPIHQSPLQLQAPAAAAGREEEADFNNREEGFAKLARQLKELNNDKS